MSLEVILKQLNDHGIFPTPEEIDCIKTVLEWKQ